MQQMNITEENIEYLIFEKLEGNLTAAELIELENFLSVNPQFQKLVDEWNSSNLVLSGDLDDYQLSDQLHKNIEGHRNSYYALFGSLIFSISVLFGTIFLNLSKDKNISQETPIIPIEKSRNIATNPIGKSNLPVIPANSTSRKITAKQNFKSEISKEENSGNLNRIIIEEEKVESPLVITSKEVTPDSLVEAQSSTEELNLKPEMDQKTKLKGKRSKLNRDAQFQEVNSNF